VKNAQSCDWAFFLALLVSAKKNKIFDKSVKTVS